MERDTDGVDKGEEGSYTSNRAGEEDDAHGQVLAGGRAAMAHTRPLFQPGLPKSPRGPGTMQ